MEIWGYVNDPDPGQLQAVQFIHCPKEFAHWLKNQ
jgi:hypothetical protein